jgi:hypothetical protein
VTYKDLDGVRHSVEVVAESVYEASVLALSALSKHEWVESRGPRDAARHPDHRAERDAHAARGAAQAVAGPTADESRRKREKTEAEGIAGKLNDGVRGGVFSSSEARVFEREYVGKNIGAQIRH